MSMSKQVDSKKRSSKECSLSPCDQERIQREGAKGPCPPPPNRWIIMLHNLFKVGKCIGSKYEGPFFLVLHLCNKKGLGTKFCL